MTVDNERFVATLWRRLDEDPTISPGKSWVAGRAHPDGTAVVLYRASADGPVVGRRWILSELVPLFGTEDAAVLASAVYASEIAEPEGDLGTLDVDWAAELVEDPSQVLWAGTSQPGYAARRTGHRCIERRPCATS